MPYYESLFDKSIDLSLSALRFCVKAALAIGVFYLLLAAFVSLLMSRVAAPRIFDDVQKIPYRPYGLLLGTSKFFADNTPNLFYKYRIEAAEQLYRAGKVEYLLLSGDNRTRYYNEPRWMLKDLVTRNVPEENLFKDPAGYRTFDSVVRADKVFQANHLIVVSQRFHCERALFIARYRKIDALCLAARYPEGHNGVLYREFFARPLTLFSLLLGQEPTLNDGMSPLPQPTRKE